MKNIPLSQGATTIVDDNDFEMLSKYPWYLSDQGYAVRNGEINGRKRPVRMHRVLMGAPDGVDIDHIDGNRLNNQRANLRTCTRAENLRNQGAKRGVTSRFKGVYWLKANHKWRAKIQANGKCCHLGCFDTEESAAKAYDQAALNYFGEFARTNAMEAIYAY